MADQGRSDVCVVFIINLCALKLKQMLISLLFHTALKLANQALKSYLKMTCKSELDILPNRKVSAVKDYG